VGSRSAEPGAPVSEDDEFVVAGDRPGNEIQSPMAQVILGGLLSSTFLNLAVVPLLFWRWGGPWAAEAPREPQTV
jgi:hypothetical protein